MKVTKIKSDNNLTNFQAKKSKTNLQKLKPLSEYTKPLLKLTTEDEEKISILETKIAQLRKYADNNSKNYIYKNYTVQHRNKIDATIRTYGLYIIELQEKIRKIKINRYRQQLAELK